MTDLRSAAETAVNQCLGLAADESCVVVTDDKRQPIGEALYEVASEVTEDATMTSERPTPPADGSLPNGPVDPAVESRDDVQQAVADEAERMDVPVDQVSIAGYADVTWLDGSIGCPGEGRMYTQALVPCHQLILEVDGELASYHAAEGKPFKYCAEPNPPYETSADS